MNDYNPACITANITDRRHDRTTHGTQHATRKCIPGKSRQDITLTGVYRHITYTLHYIGSIACDMLTLAHKRQRLISGIESHTYNLRLISLPDLAS